METKGIISMIIGVTVAVIIVATVLLPQLTTYTDSTSSSYVGGTYAGLLGVVGILAVVGLVLVVVKSYDKE